MSKESRPLLVLNACSAAYGQMTVVSKVHLEVRRGEVHALLGPNGAGKTSLLEAVAGRIGNRGEIWLDNERIDGLSTHQRVKRGLALVPISRGLFPSLTVADNLELGARLAPIGRRLELYRQTMQFFPSLKDRLDQHAGDMSGGEQQMLALARALIGAPKALLLDEPTQGLAPRILDVICTVIQGSCERGLAVLLAEQNHEFASRLAKHFSILVQGTIVRQCDTESVGDARELFALYLGSKRDREAMELPAIRKATETAYETPDRSRQTERTVK